MSKPRKSRATGEKVGWVSRKDGDAMAGSESGSRLFIFHGVQPSPGLSLDSWESYACFSLVNHPYLKNIKGASFSHKQMCQVRPTHFEMPKLTAPQMSLRSLNL